MESQIAQAMSMKFEPVAVILTDDKPENARQFKEGKWGCVMFMLGAAACGKTAVFDRKSIGCPGGGVGLGFGNLYQSFAGGMDGFCHFLSTGNKNSEKGKQAAEQMAPYLPAGRKEFLDDFLEGERYVKSPELVEKFVDCLPITDIPNEYVVFKPLCDVDPDKEKPVLVTFLADMDQFSGLVVLANFGNDNNQSVIIPMAAGCQTMVLIPMHEAKSEKPRAVAGLTDISARVAIKRQLKQDLLTFSIPWELFLEMEGDVAESFLGRNTWKDLMKLKQVETQS